MISFIRSFLLISLILLIYSSELKPQSFEWASKITSSTDMSFIDGITVDKNGNSYVTGGFIGITTFDTIQINNKRNYEDIFIAKYDPKGKCIWAKQVVGTGNSNNRAASIAIDSQGNSYISGSIAGTAVFDTIQLNSYGGGDIYLAKYDPYGNCLWANHAGGTGTSYSESGNGIAVDKSGNSYLTGYFVGSAKFDSFQMTSFGDGDIFISKYAPDGICLWVKQAGGSNFDFANGISIDSSGNSYITGGFQSTDVIFDTIHLPGFGKYGFTKCFTAKYDINGNCLWAKQAGGNSISYSITVDAAGSSYITGYFGDTLSFGSTTLINSEGTTNSFNAKYDLNGNCLWANQLKDIKFGESIGYGISVDSSGNCFATGYFHGAAMFGSIPLQGYGGHDVYIAEYNRDGNCVYAVEAGGADQDDYGSAIVADGKGNSYVTGYYDSNTSLFGTINLSGPGAFIAKVSNGKDAVYSTVNPSPTEYSLNQNYPNPFNPSTTISYSLPKAGNIKLTVYNAIGSKVVTLVNEYKPAGNYSVRFNGSSLASGIYLYRLESGSYSAAKKFILMK